MKHRSLHLAVAGAATALIASIGPGAAVDEPETGSVADGYILELLDPTNGGATANALGVNDAGDVVGITRPTSSAQPQQTVLWERHGDHFHAHELANLAASQFSRGFAVNASQVIVGEAFDAGGASIPIRWSADGTPEHVTGLNETGTGVLRDINDEGSAVGTASGRAVLVAPGGEVSVLPAPVLDVEGATVANYSAAAIAENGIVGGRASIAVPHGDHTDTILPGVVWRDGTAHVLDLPSGSTAANVANVTADGEAVGTATIGSTETAVAWTTDGSVTTLPSAGISDHPHSAAKATNGDVIVGYASRFAGNTSFGGAALAWDTHGAVDLNARVPGLPEGVNLQSASDINASGQIVGAATTTDGTRGFVLTPALDGSPATVLSIDGLAGLYHPGDVVTLTAVQDPPTELDHYHWFTRTPGTQEWVVVPGVGGDEYSFTATTDHDGVEIIARLYNEDHAVVAESAPATIAVDDHGDPEPPGDLSQRIVATLPEDEGALVASIDPDDNTVTMSDFELGTAGDHWSSTGHLRPVTVTDTRSSAPGWVVSGQVGDFTTDGGDTLAGKHLGWTPLVADQPDGGNVTPATVVTPGLETGDGLAVSNPLATAATGSGTGTSRLGAGLLIQAPTTLTPGTYQATITFTAI